MSLPDADLAVERIEPSRDSWNDLVFSSQDANLLQTWEYGLLKARSGSRRIEHIAIRKGQLTIAIAIATVIPSPLGLPGGFAWINRGPIRTAACDGVGTSYRSLLEAITTYYRVLRGFFVRIAPAVREHEERDLMASSAYRATATAGWASGNIDLRQPLDDIRARLRSNWRYSVRKMEKEGIKIDIGSDATRFGRFLECHRQFIADRSFPTSVTPDFLDQLQALLPDDRKMTVFSAIDGTESIGSALIVRYGSICEYLAGNTAGTRSHGSGAGQFLIWNAIVEMKKLGCTSLDLGGMDEQRTPKGIYEFKMGVNPTPYRLANEIESGGTGLVGSMIRAVVTRLRRTE